MLQKSVPNAASSTRWLLALASTRKRRFRETTERRSRVCCRGSSLLMPGTNNKLLNDELGRVLINPERSQTWRCPRSPRKRTSGPAFGPSALCPPTDLCGPSKVQWRFTRSASDEFNSLLDLVAWPASNVAQFRISARWIESRRTGRWRGLELCCQCGC